MKYLLIFILGIGITWISFQYYKNLYDPIEMECKIQLKGLSDNLSKFKNKCGRLPFESEGLKALEDPKSLNCNLEPILNKVPLDPWNGEFIYLLKNNKAYLLGSKSECGYEIIK
jgi:hypothetical protein